MDRLYEYIRRFAVVNKQEFEQMSILLEVRHCNKKEILTQKGEIENYLYIVSEGMVRKYFYKGKYEVLTQLAKEGDLVCSSVSFLSQHPSEYVVETMEPCVLFALSYSKMQQIFSMGFKMERLGRLITLDWLLQKEIWEHNRIRLDPQDRFKQFIKENGDLVQRVPQKYLASYLNIKPETFSRYKHFLKH